jgi:hypothetical protein
VPTLTATGTAERFSLEKWHALVYIFERFLVSDLRLQQN